MHMALLHGMITIISTLVIIQIIIYIELVQITLHRIIKDNEIVIRCFESLHEYSNLEIIS